MDQTELTRRLAEPIEPRFIKPNPKACWLDGDECPYGQPEGKFRYRPTNFCQVGVCMKLDDYVSDFENMSGIYIERLVNKKLIEKLDNEIVTLSSELRVISEEIKNEEKKKLLILTADLIEDDENIENVRIIRETDICG